MSTFNIQVTPQNNTILIVDNDQNQVIVENPITSVVEVNSLGPQGPPGPAGVSFPYTGSAVISGSLVVTGSIIATQGFTGSLLGTASYALNAVNSQGNNIFQYSTTEDQLNDWAGDIINGVYGFVNVTGSLLNSASYSSNFQLFEILQTSRLLSVLDQTGANITSSLNINEDTELNIGTYFSAPSGSYFTGLTFNIYNPNQEIKLYYTSSQPPLQQDSYFTTSSLRLEKNLVVVEGITGSLFGTSSYALTASYAMNGGGGGTTVNTGSFVTTSSFNSFTSSINTFTSSYNTGSFTGSFTGSLFGTASYTNQSLSSSYALTASFALNAGTTINTGSFVTTSSFNNFTSSYNTGSFTGSFTGSLLGTASISITESRTITFNLGSIPTSITTGSKTNSIFYSAYSGSIKGFILTANTGSTTTLDLWKRNNTLPTSSDTIIVSNKPQLINNQFTSSYNVSNWTSSFNPNDVFIINVETNTSASNLSLQLITEIYK